MSKTSQSPDSKPRGLVAKYSSIQDHILRLMKIHGIKAYSWILSHSFDEVPVGSQDVHIYFAAA